MKEELIDLEGAYEDLKDFVLNLNITCGNCIHKDRDISICNKCQFAYFWELDPKIIDEIENKNLIEDEEVEMEEAELSRLTDLLKCPKCNKQMIVDTSYQLASYPPKYETFCECGYDGYIFCKDYVG